MATYRGQLKYINIPLAKGEFAGFRRFLGVRSRETLSRRQFGFATAALTAAASVGPVQLSRAEMLALPFARRVRAFREAKGLTVDRAAQLAEVPADEWANWDANGGSQFMTDVRRGADVLELDCNEMFRS